MYSINVKTAEPIGPKFCVEPHLTQGRFLDAQNFENPQKIIIKSAKVFYIAFLDAYI